MNNSEIKKENEEITRKESLEKLKKTSKGVAKGIDVLRIILISLAVLCLIAGILCIVSGACGWLTTIYEKHPTQLGSVKLKIDDDTVGVFLNTSFGGITLKDIYDAGELDKLCYGLAVGCFAGIVNLLVAFAITFLIKPIFTKLSNDETPFTFEMAKRLKIGFIILTIIVIISDAVIGIITGGFLTCLYFIFLYGCCLQKDDDETL